MKRIWTILTIGILIRIFLASTTFHPDIRAFDLGGRLIASGNILNLYDYQATLSVDDPMRKLTEFIYPPAIYWFHGVFHFLLGSILGVSLLVKLPYLLFDLLIGFLLLRWFASKKQALLAFTLWMFNPISLYATYMMGQFDIIPTFFIVLSIYLIAKNKLYLAALALGGGIAFKLYPIFLVVPLLILGKTYFEKFKLVILTILPYILSIAPYIGSVGFRSKAFIAGQADKSLYVSIPVSGGEAILLFPTFLILFYFFIWSKKIENLSFWKIYLIPLLLFFIFTHYHPQWLIWVTPFLIISLVSEGFKNILPITLILISWFGSLFFFDPSLTLGMFAPLFPFLRDLPSIWVLLYLNPDYNLSRSLIQTVFAASALYLIYQYFPRKNNPQDG